MWNGAFQGGEAVAATYTDDDGEVVDLIPQFTFAFVDSDDYTAGDLDYICYVRYDMVDDGFEAADFSGYSAWSGYEGLSFRVRTDIAEARYEGACDGVASMLGVTKVDEWVDGFTWGYGYGPMTDEWSSDMVSLGLEIDSLGDTIGTTYLEWEAAGEMTLNLWGYFQVYGFTDGTHFDVTTEPLIGVSGSMTPLDGFYSNTIVYILTFS